MTVDRTTCVRVRGRARQDTFSFLSWWPPTRAKAAPAFSPKRLSEFLSASNARARCQRTLRTRHRPAIASLILLCGPSCSARTPARAGCTQRQWSLFGPRRWPRTRAESRARGHVDSTSCATDLQVEVCPYASIWPAGRRGFRTAVSAPAAREAHMRLPAKLELKRIADSARRRRRAPHAYPAASFAVGRTASSGSLFGFFT